MIYALTCLIVCLVLLVIFIGTRPPAFAVARSLTIAAPTEVVFDQVNDLHAWRAWSPFEKLDPDVKRTYEGPASGVGASYAWAGNRRAGEGRMTIERSERPIFISNKLQFTRPFKAIHVATFTFTPEMNGTKVTWSMTGKNNFMAKAFCLFINMDKIVGHEFAEGLMSLKAVVEKSPAL